MRPLYRKLSRQACRCWHQDGTRRNKSEIGPPTRAPATRAAQNGGQDSAAGAPASTANAGPPGPIGATMQTMPAKFSHRNDLLDHMPVVAWPLPLDEQQRQQIYKAVMED